MSDSFDPWLPHEHPQYDAILTEASNFELELLKRANTSARTAFIKNPRQAHHRLYSQLTPESFPEYAGTYRGAMGTSLETRRLAPPPLGDEKGVAEFMAPEKVEKYMGAVGQIGEQIETESMSSSAQKQFELAARLFYVFGLVHPFLDGNGHIQRLMFATAVFQSSSLELAPNWTIHPRPYDIEMAEAFNGDDRLQAVAGVLGGYVDFGRT